MNATKKLHSIMTLVVMTSALLAGCTTPPKPLYQWERYQPQVYEYFKGQGEGPDAQIRVLEEDLEKIRSAGNRPPPGYHAQLGLLFTQTGNNDRAVQEFLVEKDLYPESSVYMDFLLKKLIK